MTLGKKDKAVLHAFTDGEPLAGHKLHTDGISLDGYGMGLRNVAVWVWVKGSDSPYPGIGKKIRFADLGTRSAQTIQRAVRKIAPKKWIEE
jgi:hypothetical protein